MHDMHHDRPTFVFDGDCGICRTWVNYWRQLTGNQVAYRPYQEAAADFPAIPAGDFKHAVQLIEPDGTVYAGAAATFRLLSYAPDRGAWWWLYRFVPGFAALSEAAYRFISTRRGLLTGATHLLWGRTLEPPRYDLVAWLFLRGLGLIYLAAFVSVALQIRGLVGSEGILPLGEYLDGRARRMGHGRLLAPADAVLAECLRHRVDGRCARRHCAEPARHARHRQRLALIGLASSTCRSSTPGSCSSPTSGTCC